MFKYLEKNLVILHKTQASIAKKRIVSKKILASQARKTQDFAESFLENSFEIS